MEIEPPEQLVVDRRLPWLKLLFECCSSQGQLHAHLYLPSVACQDTASSCGALGRVRSVLRCPRRTGDDGTIAGSFPLLQHIEKAVQVAASLSQEIGSHTTDFLYDRILVHWSIPPSALRVYRESALRTRADDTLARCGTDSPHSRCGDNSTSKDSLSHARSRPQCGLRVGYFVCRRSSRSMIL